MEPSASPAPALLTPAHESDSSDEDQELTDAEYAQLIQSQLQLDEEELDEDPPAAPAAQNDAQPQGFGFNRGVVVFNVGRYVISPRWSSSPVSTFHLSDLAS